MSRGKPRSPAWARFYRIHTNVLASWNEANGYEPDCPCERCVQAEEEARREHDSAPEL